MKRIRIIGICIMLLFLVGCEEDSSPGEDEYYLSDALDPSQYAMFVNSKLNAAIASVQTSMITLKYVQDGTSSLEAAQNELNQALETLRDTETRLREMIPNEEFRSSREFALQEVELTITTLMEAYEELQEEEPSKGVLSHVQEELLARYNGLTGATIQTIK